MEENYKDTRIIENLPIKIEKNTIIQNFCFEIGGHFGGYQKYEYKIKKGEKILSYIEEGEEIFITFPLETTIKDEKFNEKTIEIIKYFHEDFGENHDIIDGEWYEFKAKLSNGQKLKSSGYNYFPHTYNQFKEYLSILFKYEKYI